MEINRIGGGIQGIGNSGYSSFKGGKKGSLTNAPVSP